MPALRVFLSRLRAFLTPQSRERALHEELQTHLDLLVQENLRRGLPLAEARQAARREFGGVEQTRQDYRERRSFLFLDQLLQDFRFAVRGLLTRPGFAAVAILTLALGIGATTAVFSVVDRILFRSLPYPHDEQLVSFGDKAPFETNEFVLGPDYVDWRAQQTPFASVAALVPGGADCDLTEKDPLHLRCALVESTFLPTLGIQPLLGRNFSPEEDRPRSPRVAVISYGLWRSRFGGDTNIAGRTILLDGRPTAIIGVLPAQFEMPTLAADDILVPAALDNSTDRSPNARQIILRAFARLKPGVSIAQARAAMQPLFEKSLDYVPPQFRREVSFSIRSLRDRQVQNARSASWILFASVLAVLLVSCTNVAGLLLARATGRRREIAIRSALGATKARLTRQALTESVLLGILGGIAGSLAATFLIRLFVAIAPQGIPRLSQAALDTRVFVFVLITSLLSGLLFGIAPAVRRPVPEALAGRENHGAGRQLLRQLLVTAQIAVTLMVVAAAGLLLRSFTKLESVALGMDSTNVITARINLAQYRYPDGDRQFAFFEQLQQRLEHLPGASRLALADSLPPAGDANATFFSSFEIPGHLRFREGTGGMIGYRSVTPGYFSALSIPILSGRGFMEEDRSPATQPVILSESLASKLFPNGENPVGQSLRFGGHETWHIIVGVAADVKNNGLAEAADPEFYVPWRREPGGVYRFAHIILQTALRPATVSEWLRTEVGTVDPSVPVTVETLRSRVAKLADGPRFNAALLTLFAVMSLLLAAIGIYGIVAFLVTQQTREIGVRMALGASHRQVLRLILTNAARWTAIGASLGLLGTWFSSRLLEALLFEVRPRDPVLIAVATAFLVAIVFIAAWIPARRAMRVDPLVALRYE